VNDGYEYRVFEKRAGVRVIEPHDDDRPVYHDLERAKTIRTACEFTPKSGSWHIERRPVGGWEEI
jgi:hypothetical protein